MKTMSVNLDYRTKSFAEILEEEWNEQSEALEEKHFDAAFDAKVAEIDSTTSTTEIINYDHHHHPDVVTIPTIIKKSNCYSPYVPSSALRIQAMMEFVQFRPNDIFCDIGCGDGRVCVAVAHHVVVHNNHNDDDRLFRAIGIDVSPDCIQMAQEHLKIMNQQLVVSDDVKKCIQFYLADLTIPPDELLSETSPLRHDLLSVTVIYLYTYPTLLVQLLPLLAQLFQIGQLRVVVTLTYHLHELPPPPPPESTNTTTTTGMEQQQQQQQRHWTYQLDGVNETHDLCRYTHVSLHPVTGSNVTAMTELSE